MNSESHFKSNFFLEGKEIAPRKEQITPRCTGTTKEPLCVRRVNFIMNKICKQEYKGES